MQSIMGIRAKRQWFWSKNGKSKVCFMCVAINIGLLRTFFMWLHQTDLEHVSTCFVALDSGNFLICMRRKQVFPHLSVVT